MEARKWRAWHAQERCAGYDQVLRSNWARRMNRTRFPLLAGLLTALGAHARATVGATQFQTHGFFWGIAISGVLAAASCLAEEEYTSARSQEACLAYQASPFSRLSMDYFARLER